jgi:CRISP-associated protein Cas1
MAVSGVIDSRTAASSSVGVFQAATGLPLLEAGWERVAGNGGAAGGDGMTIALFGFGARQRLERLSDDLRIGRYRPGPVAHVTIPKKSGGTRILSIPSVRDRVAQTAAFLAIRDLSEREAEDASHAYRPGRGVHTAINALARHHAEGFHWAVDVDVKAFFDTVPHVNMLAALGDITPDARFIDLVAQWLRLSRFPGRGLPQGAPISPVLANIYLDRIDEWIAGAGYRIVRYADDFVILSRDEAAAKAALAQAASMLQALGLEINVDKTVIRPVDAGFTFLGRLVNRGTLARQLAELEADAAADLDADVIAAREAGITHDAMAPEEALGGGLGRAQAEAAIAPVDAGRKPRKSRRSPWDLRNGAPDVPPAAQDSAEHTADDDAGDDAGDDVMPGGGAPRHSEIIRPLHMVTPGLRLDAFQSGLGVFEGARLAGAFAPGMIDRIDVHPGGEVTGDALRAAARHGISVFMVDGHGMTLSAAIPGGPDRAGLHLAQARIALDPVAALALARLMVAGRIWNARRLLQRLRLRLGDGEAALATRLESVTDQLDHVRRKAELDPSITTMDALRGHEAWAAKLYWPALAATLKRGFAEPAFSRTRQPPKSPFNTLVNWTSHLLQRDIHAIAARRGLHAGFGVLHSAADHRHALVYDLMEEFRAPVAEALAAMLLATGEIGDAHFERFTLNGEDAVRIGDGGAAKVIRAHERLVDKRIRSPHDKAWTSWRGLMDAQVRRYVGHVLRGEPYAPLRMDV